MRDFLDWILANYQIRWLTSWCTTNQWLPGKKELLADVLGIPLELLAPIEETSWARSGTRAFFKPDGINWEEFESGVPFIWIEDGIPPDELEYLREKGAEDCYIFCDVNLELNGLVRLLEALKEDPLGRSYIRLEQPSI